MKYVDISRATLLNNPGASQIFIPSTTMLKGVLTLSGSWPASLMRFGAEVWKNISVNHYSCHMYVRSEHYNCSTVALLIFSGLEGLRPPHTPCWGSALDLTLMLLPVPVNYIGCLPSAQWTQLFIKVRKAWFWGGMTSSQKVPQFLKGKYLKKHTF